METENKLVVTSGREGDKGKMGVRGLGVTNYYVWNK